MTSSTGPETPIRVARFWPLVSGIGAIVLVVLLGAVILYRENNKPFGFELEWMDEVIEHRTAFWTIMALIFNSLGGGVIAIAIAPLLIVAGLLVFRRPWAALYFGIAELATTLVVQLLKQLYGRPRPTDILISIDSGSFPSGHSANAAVIATTLGIVFARAWVWAVGAIYTVGMMLSRTYLGAHWISDTVGGALIGVGIAVIVWAPFAYRLYREQRAPHPPIWKRLPAAADPAGTDA